MFWGILQRTIFLELVRVFLLALVALTGILLLGGIVAEASQQGLGPGQILAAIPLLIPSFLPYTLPTTTLFATCVVYGRLAHDNEILAIKAAGINLLKVVGPAVLLGLLVSSVTLGLYWDTIPRTHHLLRTEFLKDVEELLYNKLKLEGQIKHPKIPYEIFVKQVQGRKLINAEFRRKDHKGSFDFIATAREAELLVELAHNRIQVRMRHCFIQGPGGAAYVEEKTWPIDIPGFFDPKKQRPTDMTWEEMLVYRGKILEELQDLRDIRKKHQDAIDAGGAPANFPDHVRDLDNRIRLLESQWREVIVQMHMRPSLALGCLCFVLVGCPVGIWFSRSDYLSAFITCFLPIVFIYYPLNLCGINVAKSGFLPIPLAIWAANAVILTIGLELYRRLLKN